MQAISVRTLSLGHALQDARPMLYPAVSRGQFSRDSGPGKECEGWECAVLAVADTLDAASHGTFDRAAFYEAAGFLDLFPG